MRTIPMIVVLAMLLSGCTVVRTTARVTGAVVSTTAVVAGADRFVTSNRRDFPASISAIDVTYPEDLDEP